jgi:serine/threonine protein kinase
MSLPAGTRLGAYQIVSLLGIGGMGEVYRARDSRLKRDVAIKVLPAFVAAHPDRVARFQREAEMLAALNHPNIAHIHGLEDSNGVSALVMEFIDGPTLADRIAESPGGLPLREIVAVARQIASALEAAHDRGIVHRDLKPANIKITPAGVVKVLDFGLAQLSRDREGAESDPEHSIQSCCLPSNMM